LPESIQISLIKNYNCCTFLCGALAVFQNFLIRTTFLFRKQHTSMQIQINYEEMLYVAGHKCKHWSFWLHHPRKL